MHDYTIPIGPLHPTLKEPMCIRIGLEGSVIKQANIRMGYTHKGIEKILEGKNPDSALYISQRICGICSAAHENAYTRTVEGILGFEAGEKVKLLRAMMMELERMHSHLLWLGIIAHEIGYETLFMYFWREREKILDVFEKIAGGRVHHNFNKIKTVRYDLEHDDKRFILKRIEDVRKSIYPYISEIKDDNVIKARLKGVGVIDNVDARRFCLIGPNSRASGVSSDIRKIDPPYGIYDEFEFDEIVLDKGDSFERTLVRLKEVLESVKILKQILDKMPETKIPNFTFTTVPDDDGIGRVEAPRGELFYFLKFKDNKIVRAKIRTPTFGFLKILEKILIDQRIGDVPVLVASLDPCFSCLERIMVVKDGKTETLNEKDFRRRYVCTR